MTVEPIPTPTTSEPSPTGWTLEKAESATLVELLDLWRNAPVGSFQYGDAVSARIQERLVEAREADPVAYSDASKLVGWS
jgi:hypothetical protein